METLEQILKKHAHRYPNMQPPDAVKLIWQNVFGSGALRRDPASYRCALMHEYEDVQASAEISLVENIGNGFVRINLAATHWCGYSPERLGYDYVDSARHHQGSRMGFQVILCTIIISMTIITIILTPMSMVMSTIIAILPWTSCWH